MEQRHSRHHYVPQFHLRRFVDDQGRLWAWDRTNDRVFPTGPGSVAGETDFYYQPWIAEVGGDPMEMERQFSGLEATAARIIAKWIAAIEYVDPGTQFGITDDEREDFSLYVALQSLRTSDARGLIGAFGSMLTGGTLAPDDERDLHAAVLWNEEVFVPMAKRIAECTWLFGWNASDVPFVTSDNPVTHRKLHESHLWMRDPAFSGATDLAFPLSPRVIFFCYPKIGKYAALGLGQLDGRRSPITISEAMVLNENQGQVFSANRFVFQTRPDFSSMQKASKLMIHNYYDSEPEAFVSHASNMAARLFPLGSWP